MHPVFGPSQFPLSNKNAKDLYDFLRANIADVQMIDIKYRSVDEMERLNLRGSPSAIWMNALDNISASGNLQKFCESLQQEGRPPRLMNILQAIFAERSVIDRKFLASNIFLDRLKLREKITALADDNTETSLVILRGERQSGKSYGRHLFISTAREKGAVPIYLDQSLINDVNGLIRKIFANLGGYRGSLKDPLTTEDAWYDMVCTELQTSAINQKVKLWIAIDDLGVDQDNVSIMQQEIRRFVDKLVVQMINPSYREYFRLLLIDYPLSVPVGWAEVKYETDQFSQNDIQLEHVREAIEEAHLNKGLNPIQDMIKVDAAKILEEVDLKMKAGSFNAGATSFPLSRIRLINEGLTEHLKTIK